MLPGVSYPASSGHTRGGFWDYYVTDPIVSPPFARKFYSEKLVYMPYSYQLNSHRHMTWPKVPRTSAPTLDLTSLSLIALMTHLITLNHTLR